jgi:4-hydroxythreonine-4-phosphate dehydrogenase
MGDPSGIGPELAAKLLAEPRTHAQAAIALIGEPWVLERGQATAGTHTPVDVVDDEASLVLAQDAPTLLRLGAVRPEEIRPGQATEAGGRAALGALRKALDLALDGTLDAIHFAPLNKQALHMAGMGTEDELQWLAAEIGHQGPCGEINVLDRLWTTRVTSHVALRDVAALITIENVMRAIELADGALRAAGNATPSIGVAGLNPHAGDGGIFGREEIDVIAPAVERVREIGIDAEGPLPADTIFVRAREGLYDAVVTMYHDQGQIAMKLMGFDRGVTVLGGLPVPIATPAHGTAFDIVGQGIASLNATRRAFEIAVTMGARRAAERS